MLVREFAVVVLRTNAPKLVVLRLGVSIFQGSRRVFFTSQFRETFKTIVQAVRDFPTVRRNNKLWQRKRRQVTG